MNHHKTKIIAIVLLAGILANPFIVQASASLAPGLVKHYTAGQPGAAQGVGLDGVRKENDQVITFPLDKAQEVYSYLVDHYYTHTDFLNQQFPGLTFKTSTEEDHFTDDYFDTPSLDLLDKQNLIRHRKRIDLTNATDVKNGRELIQMKLSHDIKNAVVRDELKWDTVTPKVTNDNSNLTAPDNRPLSDIIKKKELTDFETAVQNLGLNPSFLKKIFTIDQRRQRLYVNWDNVPIITLSVDTATIDKWWAHTSFVDMEQQLSEIAYTQADADSQKTEVAIREAIIQDLKTRFPFIQTSSEPKYNTAFDLLAPQIPFYRWLIKLNLI